MEIHVSTKKSCSSSLGITHRVLLRHLQKQPIACACCRKVATKLYVGCLNEKYSALIHFGKEKRLSKCCQLRAQIVPEDTNGKEMATTLTPFFLLPVLLLHCQRDSSFKYFVIYLPSFNSAPSFVCNHLRNWGGKKKRKQSKTPRPEGRNILGCQEKDVILWFTAYLYCWWLALGN